MTGGAGWLRYASYTGTTRASSTSKYYINSVRGVYSFLWRSGYASHLQFWLLSRAARKSWKYDLPNALAFGFVSSYLYQMR